jgi:hypothetical protein
MQETIDASNDATTRPRPSIAHLLGELEISRKSSTIEQYQPLVALPTPEATIRAASIMLLSSVLDLLESNPHSFSKQPCATCRAISVIAGRDFGCNKLRETSDGS